MKFINKYVLCCLIFYGSATYATVPADDARWKKYINSGEQAYNQGEFNQAEKSFSSAIDEAKKVGLQGLYLQKTYGDLSAVYHAVGKDEQMQSMMKQAMATPDNTKFALSP